jgi:putative addiction module CopG family antidote
MNVHLGDLEDYVQEKLAGGGYSSAAEVIREALRKMRELETEEAIERRLEAYVLRGLDQGPPDGVPAEDWDRRLAAVRDRMSRFVAEGIEQAERGELVAGDEAVERIRDKQKRRRRAVG